MTNKTRRLRNTNNSNKKTEKLKELCREHANAFNQFEPAFEAKLKEDPSQHHQNMEKQLIRLFKTPFTPTKYRSQDDYYTYINYQWINQKTKELKKELKHYVQIDSFRITQEKVFYELMEIVKEFIQTNRTPLANAVKKVYHSLYNLNPSNVRAYIGKIVNKVDELLSKDSMFEFFGEINQNEIVSWGCPLVWNVMRDEKNVKKYISTISAPQLTIYDYQIYIDDAADPIETKRYKREFKQQYIAFISKMFSLCLGANHGLNAMDVWDCELEILTALGCNKVKTDSEDGYNVVHSAEALAKYGFDWELFTQTIGYKKEQVPRKFICTSTNYLKCIIETLQKGDAWKNAQWRTYYLYIMFRQIIRFHKDWRMVYYQFHDKYIKGQPVPYPREIYPVFGLSFCFNTFLTNSYIERNKKQQYIDYTHNMASDLLHVYKRIIRRNRWMSPSTKKYALLKLENIHLEVGSPKLLREDPLLDYVDDNAYYNLQLLAIWRCKQMIQLDGKSSEVDIPIIDWEEFKIIGKQSYVVNAYYTPTENSIYVPLAYLQKPFIDLDERGIEYNLAHIGYTLAHEMSHCLDDLGSKYDHRGNLHNWWTEGDRRVFERKGRDVVKQYEAFAGYDGIKMDATLSLGENLADISGLAICEEYLNDFQEKNNDIVPIRALSFQAFFVYVAVQARQKIFDEAIKAQLKTNPHPMDKYRTNCPLSRLKLFRSLYNVQPKDKMYWPSTDTIW
jgi:putative endopeptidase